MLYYIYSVYERYDDVYSEERPRGYRDTSRLIYSCTNNIILCIADNNNTILYTS